LFPPEIAKNSPSEIRARRTANSTLDASCDSRNWFRAYRNENWEFDENGLMTHRYSSINDLPIIEVERKSASRLDCSMAIRETGQPERKL
jgi:nuclear transport factor 2 (NTF2) superfamily protein